MNAAVARSRTVVWDGYVCACVCVGGRGFFILLISSVCVVDLRSHRRAFGLAFAPPEVL